MTKRFFAQAGGYSPSKRTTAQPAHDVRAKNRDDKGERAAGHDMADGKASGESKNVSNGDVATPRRMKAPPKTAPPPSTKDAADAKSGGGPTKKKALPPPSNPPPKGGVSAAAAFRAKSSLPPPNGPPPNGAAPSASVAKIRGAARPPSGPPPSGGQAKAIGPPSKAPPSMAPPSMAPPPKGEAKAASTPRSAGESKDDTKNVTAAPARGKPDVKRIPPTSGRSPQVEAKVTPRAEPVDILGDEAPAIASASTHARNERGISPAMKPPKAMRAPVTAPPIEKAPVVNPMHTVVKKSTMEVLNDTTAALSSRHRNLDDEPAPLQRASTLRPGHEGNAGGVFTTKMGKAAQFSGQSRPNVPEEEIITVKRRSSKKADAEAEGQDGAQAKAGGDAKKTKAARVHVPNLDDSFEDVEEIPFLEDVKSDPKQEEKLVAAEEDDPIIVMESKHGSPKASGNRSSTPQGDGKDEYKSNNFDVEDKEDADGLLSNRRNATHEDIYGELRKMKRGSPRDDDARSDSVESRGASFSDKKDRVSNHSDEGAKDAGTAPSNGGGNREKSREKRKDKRRSKKEEPKKIQAQFFNPKSVPYIPDHLMDFVKRPLEAGRGQIIKCFIERNDSGPNKLAPIYTLLLEVNSSSGRPIMYARKKPTSRLTSHYVISMNRDDLFLSRMMRSHQYMGKLRSNAGYMEYSLYDQGDNPEDVDSDCEVDDEIRQSVRADLGYIRYHNSKKPYSRKMEVAIPAVLANGTGHVEWRPLSRDQMMEEHVRTIFAAGGQNVLDSSNFIFMHKRETKYDPLSSCIVDFRSRATCVSVKNFQLVHSEPMSDQLREQYRKAHPEYIYEDQGTVSLPQEHVLLQLGKVGKDCFNMDFQYPLSMMQAFAICLSRFDSKQR